MCKSPQAKSMSACTVPQLDGTPAAWTSRRWRHTGWGGVIFGAPVSPCQSLHPTLTGPGCVMVHMPHARLTSVSLLEGNCARMEPVCSSNLCNGVEVVAEKRLDGRGGPVARRLATHRLAKLINSCNKLRRCVTHPLWAQTQKQYWYKSSPQHQMSPTPSSPHEYLSPAPSATNVCPPASCTGWYVYSFWPFSGAAPQHHVELSNSRPQVCQRPAAVTVKAWPPSTGFGSGYLPSPVPSPPHCTKEPAAKEVC